MKLGIKKTSTLLLVLVMIVALAFTASAEEAQLLEPGTIPESEIIVSDPVMALESVVTTVPDELDELINNVEEEQIESPDVPLAGAGNVFSNVDKTQLQALRDHINANIGSYFGLYGIVFMSDAGDWIRDADKVLSNLDATQELVDSTYNGILEAYKAGAGSYPPGFSPVGGSVDPDVFTVTFDTQGGSAVDAQDVEEGDCATEPAEYPTKEGFIFVGWFTAATGGTEWDFDSPITANVTIFAQWEEEATNTPPLLDGWYLLSTPEHLLWFANEVNSGNNAIKGKLTADIITTADYTPIGTATNPFKGQFDGDGHTVNLNIVSTAGYQALFARVGVSGYTGDPIIIQNVTVKGTVSGGANVGGVVGYATNSTITNCHNEADITGTSSVGGIVGSADGYGDGAQVTKCSNQGNITGTGSNIGGIAGQSIRAVEDCINGGNVTSTGNFAANVGGIAGSGTYSFSGCLNTGNIKGNNYIGGIVGYLNASSNNKITNCGNTGTVTATNANNTTTYGAGGIVAFASHAYIDSCFNTGSIECNTTNTGGIIGYLSDGASAGTSIINCYNLGTVKHTGTIATANTGGIAGRMDWATIPNAISVENCYNAGDVLGGTSNNQGAIAGQSAGLTLVSNNYYLANKANKGIGNQTPTDVMVKVVTDAELKALAPALKDAYITGTEYPILKWQGGGVEPVITFTVTFDTQGGSAVDAQDVEEGDCATEPVEDPTKEGFIFVGWFDAATGGTEWDFGSPITANVIIYAQWEEDKSGVTLTLSTDKTSYKAGDIITLTASLSAVKSAVAFNDATIVLDYDKNILSFTGYEWIVSNYYDLTGNKMSIYGGDANGRISCLFRKYTEHEEIPTTGLDLLQIEFTVTQDLAEGVEETIVGIFNALIDNVSGSVGYEPQLAIPLDHTPLPTFFTVTFDTQGGSAVDAQDVEEGDCATAPAEDPTKERSIFLGWFDAAEDGNEWDFETPITEDVTIYAQWTADYTPLMDGEWYLISNADELLWFANQVNGGNNAIKGRVVADIDASEAGFTPIGTDSPSVPFTGMFDGDAHTVKLNIGGNGMTNQAMFGYIKGATISNITVDGSVTGRAVVAGVVGRAENSIIKNCVNKATVSGGVGSGNGSGTGGIVAVVFCGPDGPQPEISNCENKGFVSSNSYNVGGIVGSCIGGTISGSKNSGTVSGWYGVGGIVGSIFGNANGNATVTQCFNDKDGTVTGNYSSPLDTIGVGGIVGDIDTGGVSIIDRCYNAGTVKSNVARTGGIIGLAKSSAAQIKNCYNSGAVNYSAANITYYVGGIAGGTVSGVTLVNCYNSGPVTHNNANEANKRIGGIIGNAADLNAISNNYYLAGAAAQGVNNQVDAAGKVEVKSSSELKKLAGTLGDAYKRGAVYPILQWQPDEEPAPPIMDGEWYLISDADELLWFAAQVNGGNNAIKGRVVADIDASEAGFTPIGTSASVSFQGQFDGGKFTITLDYNNAANRSYQGLFGYTSGATIKNVKLDGSLVMAGSSSYNYHGGLVGYALNSVIENCVNYAQVTGYQYVGGIVGHAAGTTTITDCVNYGDIVATGTQSRVAGIVGGLYSTTSTTGTTTITRCYNYGDINGIRYAGGILGSIENGTGRIAYCLNTGSVTTTDNSIDGTGGIAGYLNPAFSVDNSYNTGRIKGGTHTGGIVGYSNNSNSSITNCYNRGGVSTENAPGGSWTTGGIVGFTSNGNVTIANCYNAGAISGLANIKGGVVGNSSSGVNPNYSKNYYLEGTAAMGRNNKADEAGKVEAVTAAQLKKLAPTLGTAYKEGSQYPILQWQDNETLYSDFTVVLEAAGPTDLNIGDTLSVNVMVYGNGLSFLNTEVRIPYDTSRLQYVGITDPNDTVTTNETTNANGTVFFLTTHRPAVEIGADGFMLATVTFKVIGAEAGSGSLATGKSLVTVSGDQIDREPLKGEPLTFTVHNLTVIFAAGTGVTLSGDTTAYVKYGEPGLYTDATYATAFTMPVATADSGYVLADPLWSDGANSYSNAEIADMAFTAGADFTAQAVKVWNVSFYDADGALIGTSQVIAEGGFAVAPADPTAPAGMGFAGWFIADSADAEYDGETLYTKAQADAMAITEDTIFKAHFTHYDYLLTYDNAMVEILSGEKVVETASYATHGTDVTFKLQDGVDEEGFITAVYYQVDGEDEVLLTGNAGVYTIPGADIVGDITIIVRKLVKGTVTFIEFYEYFGAPTGYKVALLHVDSPLAQGSAFLYDGELMYRTIKYDDGDVVTAFFVEESLDEMGVLAKITIADEQQLLVLYNGDVNRNGSVNSNDITMVYDLYSENGPYRNDADFENAGMFNRLEADVNGDGTVNARDERAIQMLILGL